MEKLNIDCLILIFDELRADNKSLYSCLLVNKEWCHLVVPILWGKYHNYKKLKEKYYNIILSYLPTTSKKLLSDNDIKLPLTILSKSPMFNYASLYKSLRAYNINKIINFIFKVENLKEFNYLSKRNLLEQEVYKLIISQCKNIKELMWETSQPLPSFPGALTCFSQLYKLSINLCHVNSNNLYEMAQICKNLNILCVHYYCQDIPGLISLIDAQRYLKNVSFHCHIKKGICEEISNTLAKKGSTINYLSLYSSVDFISHSFLTSLVNLKDLKIYHNSGSYEGIKEFQKYLAISNFSDLQSLDIDGDLSCFKELAMLIEKTKGNISYISVCTFNKSVRNTGMLLKVISNHCPKIKHLKSCLGPKDLIYLKSLLMNCRNLKRLSLNSLYDVDDIGDELLGILTKFSPKSLNKITINGNWKYSIDVFENFFESYREQKLLLINIYNGRDYIKIEHLNVIKKYFDEGIIKKTNFLWRIKD
jgi:hypothetical protein